MSRLQFDLSEVDLTYALDLHNEDLNGAIATLPETTIRDLLLSTALQHPALAKQVLAAAKVQTPAAPSSSPTTPPGEPKRPRDSFEALRLSREAARLDVNGQTLDASYFSTKAADAMLQRTAVRRQDMLRGLCREVDVLLDLGHGHFGMCACVAILKVLFARQQHADVTAWSDVINMDTGALPQLEVSLRRAAQMTSPTHCKQLLPTLHALCDTAESQGISLLSTAYLLTKRRAAMTIMGWH